MKSSELSGKQVIGDEGWRIGEVKDLVVDPVDWRAKALEVELFPHVADEFGMKRILRSTRVSVTVENVKSIGDHVVLRVSKSQLKSILQPATPENSTTQAADSSKSDSMQ